MTSRNRPDPVGLPEPLGIHQRPQNSHLQVANNIFSGRRIVAENYTGQVRLENNLIQPVPEYFVDVDRGNLHLRAKAIEAINEAIALEEVQEDIDRQARGDQPDLGADEFERSP